MHEDDVFQGQQEIVSDIGRSDSIAEMQVDDFGKNDQQHPADDDWDPALKMIEAEIKDSTSWRNCGWLRIDGQLDAFLSRPT